jgi:two-component system cell cycle sensor histidine kinase/response regulator CckA
MGSDEKRQADADAGALRLRAEGQVWATADLSPASIPALSTDEMMRLLHEMRVQQVELELQNEELRRIQAELEASRARYFDLYDRAPLGYCTLNGLGEIVEVNLTAATLLGVPLGALIDQPLSRFILNEDSDRFYIYRRRTCAGGGQETCDLRMRRADGTHFWARLEATSAQDRDGSPQCRMVISDITESKRVETERLRQEQQAQRAQRIESIGLLAGGIAHDFNNLLCGIFAHIDMACEMSTDATVTRHLDKAMGTIERARSLTMQLTTFAKGGAPVRQVGSLTPFLQETVAFSASGSNVAVTYDIPKDVWPCIFDKNQIGQVVNNLVINAQQAMPHGGSIQVRLRNEPSAQESHPLLEKGDYVRISISDSGVGIAKDQLGRLFEPFYTTKAKGQGLGLATCQSIVTRHGGCIEVESVLGKGSTFHVLLPASCAPRPVLVAPAPVEYRGSGTILVMDDELVMREAFEDMLRSLGHLVLSRDNGREIIDLFRAELAAGRTVAALIVDLTVPGGQGAREALAEIRQVCPATPVFVTSGYTQDPVMRDPAAYGFAASIRKPFKRSELAQVLDGYFKSRA